jgi:hypothetical protein
VVVTVVVTEVTTVVVTVVVTVVAHHTVVTTVVTWHHLVTTVVVITDGIVATTVHCRRHHHCRRRRHHCPLSPLTDHCHSTRNFHFLPVLFVFSFLSSTFFGRKQTRKARKQAGRKARKGAKTKVCKETVQPVDLTPEPSSEQEIEWFTESSKEASLLRREEEVLFPFSHPAVLAYLWPVFSNKNLDVAGSPTPPTLAPTHLLLRPLITRCKFYEICKDCHNLRVKIFVQPNWCLNS